MSLLSEQFGGAAVALDVAVSEAYAVVVAPVDVQLYPDLGFYVQNQGADALESVIVETSPEESGRPWVLVDEVAAAVASGAVAFGSLSAQALKWIRIRAKCGAGDTATANFWLCAGGYGGG